MSELHSTCKDGAGMCTGKKMFTGEWLEIVSLTQDVFQSYFSTSETFPIFP